jgi:hypothetical protein
MGDAPSDTRAANDVLVDNRAARAIGQDADAFRSHCGHVALVGNHEDVRDMVAKWIGVPQTAGGLG